METIKQKPKKVKNYLFGAYQSPHYVIQDKMQTRLLEKKSSSLTMITSSHLVHLLSITEVDIVHKEICTHRYANLARITTQTYVWI